jgi:hypothetical protein
MDDAPALQQWGEAFEISLHRPLQRNAQGRTVELYFPVHVSCEVAQLQTRLVRRAPAASAIASPASVQPRHDAPPAVAGAVGQVRSAWQTQWRILSRDP